MSCAKERAEYTSSGGGTPKYAGKSAFSGAKSLFFSQMSVLIKGIAGGGLRQVDGSHVFQDFAPKNGRALIWIRAKLVKLFHHRKSKCALLPLVA
jgi:hypothetical protein